MCPMRSARHAGRVNGSPVASFIANHSISGSDTTIENGVEARDSKNLRHFTIAPILAEAMQRISDETSVSSLFD